MWSIYVNFKVILIALSEIHIGSVTDLLHSYESAQLHFFNMIIMNSK